MMSGSFSGMTTRLQCVDSVEKAHICFDHYKKCIPAITRLSVPKSVTRSMGQLLHAITALRQYFAMLLGRLFVSSPWGANSERN